jgi:hypothetical protein
VSALCAAIAVPRGQRSCGPSNRIRALALRSPTLAWHGLFARRCVVAIFDHAVQLLAALCAAPTEYTSTHANKALQVGGRAVLCGSHCRTRARMQCDGEGGRTGGRTSPVVSMIEALRMSADRSQLVRSLFEKHLRRFMLDTRYNLDALLLHLYHITFDRVRTRSLVVVHRIPLLRCSECASQSCMMHRALLHQGLDEHLEECLGTWTLVVEQLNEPSLHSGAGACACECACVRCVGARETVRRGVGSWGAGDSPAVERMRAGLCAVRPHPDAARPRRAMYHCGRRTTRRVPCNMQRTTAVCRAPRDL